MEKSEVFNASKVVEDYSSSVEELKKITTEITKTASDGRPISEELRSKLNKELDGLKTHYINLCEKAHKISKDIPENPSIYDLQKIIEEYDKISSELSEIKEILTKFIRVTSNDNDYKEALRPFQNKAREIIEKINNKTADKKIVSSEICKGAGCFIEALNVPSYKNINKETRHSLQNIFDTTVISGLAAGEYFDPQISTENEQSKPAQEPDAEPEQAQTEEPNAIDETPADNTTAEETDSALTSNQPTINEAKSENNQQPIILTSENKIRKKDKPGSKFVKELRNKKTQNLSHMLILSLLTYFGALTDIQAKKFSDIFQFSFDFFKLPIPLKLIQIAFSDLTKKDNACLISTFILTTTKERVYCLTKYTLDGFNSNPIKNLKKEFGAALQDMPLGNSKFFTDETIEEEILIDQKEKNDSLLDLLERIKDQDYLKSILSDKDFAQNPYYLLENSNETFFSPTVETTKQHEISEPEPNKPEAEQTSAQEQPKQSEPVQIEPIKSEEEIPAKQDETEPKKQAEPAEQTESESPVSEIPQPEDSIKEENIEEESTVEDSPKEKEISNADTATQETEPEQTENRDDALTTICKLIKSNKIYCATAYAKAIKNPFYDVLAYAVDDPMAKCDYLSTNIQKLNEITEERDFIEPLIVSAAMRTFFSARNNYDYNLQLLHTIIQEFEIVDTNTNFKNLIYDIVNFKKDYGNDFNSYANQDNGQSFDVKLNELQTKASDFINLINPKIIKNQFFNKDFWDFFEHITSKSEDTTTDSKMTEFVKKFIKNSCEISIDNIDDTKTETNIKKEWNKARAGKQNSFDTLGPKEKNDILQQAKKAISILIQWLNLSKERPTTKSDTASEYQNLRKSLILDLQAAEDEIKESLDLHKNDIKKYAGLKIVERTVADIKESIEENTSIEKRRKYFYVDFLKKHYIKLNKKYFPPLDSFHSDPKSLLPENRILKHAYDPENSSLEQRLDYILSNEDYCNDYGSAELILEYLKETKNEVYNQIRSKYQNNKKKKNIEELIKDGKNDAKESAETIKKKFVGDLELADAFGQFDDNSIKDTILSNVNDYWFELACEDSNYEFFHHVLDAYINDIKDNAKKRREEGLLKSLEKFKKEQNNKISVRIAEKIEKCIQDQNYTVADWLLAPDRNSEDFEDILEEDFLADFTSNYHDAYFKLASLEKSLAEIIQENKDIKNKGEIFGEIQKMAYCWFPSATPNNIGEEKLKTLLYHLGFGEPNINKQDPISLESEKTSYENYTVKRNKYTVLSISHPIAAFGSEMCTKEIRIICIPKEKIPKEKIPEQIANMIEEIHINQPILILLNCALSDIERQRLAKKSKDDKLGNKLFAVIDKTVMMYMAKKYDENAIKRNKMLMSLIMPYAYYQPYDHTSPQIPQEMFRGRKEELNAIIDPKGPNFVYGGRQLGKTALLRQAEREVKKTEGGKAVYIELTEESDYKKTLEKIVDAISNDAIENDNKIFNNQAYKPSDDPVQAWEDLKKTIKYRLVSNTQSTKNKQPISYFLLILDEADAFVNSWKDVKYKPFDILKKLQNECDGKFKFVIAGLQNVVKFNRTELAKSNNTLINNLDKEKPIRPLGLRGARELLEIPLHYLGFRFPKDKEELIYLIIANTNCFPGLIQMYCENLIKTMKKTGKTPPYEINESLISNILNDNKFQAAVKEKFLQTLGLDDEKNGGDSYYMTIALTIALMRHYKDKNKPYYCGYSPEDIKTFCEGINKKISDLETDKLKILLRELTDLNILKTTPDKNHYLFSRDNFYTMLGTETEITDEIEKIDKQWESKKKE